MHVRISFDMVIMKMVLKNNMPAQTTQTEVNVGNKLM